MQRDGTRNTQGGGKAAGGKKDMASWKPGSDAASAKDVGGEGDFGVPEGAGPSRERDYVSQNTKRSDPGNAMPNASEFDGRRTAGAGGKWAGDGSGSGGDLDPDVIGVGTGGGIAESGPDDRVGADDSDGTSREMASGGPAQGRNQSGVHRVGGNKQVRGSVVQDPDISQTATGQGAGAVTNPARGDDSFAGEVSLGEARGQDAAMRPSQDSQGLFEGDNQAGSQKGFPGDAGGDDDTDPDAMEEGA
jgi:hypothetical protein